MIRTDSAHLHVTAQTHPGMTGKQNEDRYSVSAYRLNADDPTPVLFAIVSDGIGGHRAGEVAAELAVEIISKALAQSDGRQPLLYLAKAIRAASDLIAAQAEDDTQRLGMGTTCACAWVIGNRLYTATVGDSRIYLLRGGVLRRLTVDHTWVQEALERGILNDEQARNHPNVHVIRRYLGSIKPPYPDVRIRLAGDESDSRAVANQGMRLLPGDRLLLCTDGMTDLVSDEELRIVIQTSEADPAIRTLIQMACDRGGHDNITAILLGVPARKTVPGRMKLWHWLTVGLAAACLFSLVLTGAAWMAVEMAFPPTGIPAV
ncbi:MAG: protein phosphatase 2C domain-containing protein [Chloroflexota bacterium]